MITAHVVVIKNLKTVVIQGIDFLMNYKISQDEFNTLSKSEQEIAILRKWANPEWILSQDEKQINEILKKWNREQIIKFANKLLNNCFNCKANNDLNKNQINILDRVEHSEYCKFGTCLNCGSTRVKPEICNTGRYICLKCGDYALYPKKV